MPSCSFFPACSPPGPADPILAIAEGDEPRCRGVNLLQALAALGLIVASCWRRLACPARLRGRGFGSSGMKVVAGLNPGPRERIVVVEVGETWLVIGIVPGQIRTPYPPSRRIPSRGPRSRRTLPCPMAEADRGAPRAWWLLLLILLPFAGAAVAQSAGGLPALTGTPGPGGATTYTLTIQTLLALTALTFIPALVLMMTGFTRIIIVLSPSAPRTGNANLASQSGHCRTLAVPYPISS